MRTSINLAVYIAVIGAALLIGNGVYALNAYYDIEIDRINKPNRPLPSGRIEPQRALRYAWSLMILGMTVAIVVSILTLNSIMILLWSAFTLLGVGYSVPPLKLKRRHIFGNLCFGAFAGLSYVLIGAIYRPASFYQEWWLYAIIVTIYVAGIITMKDFYDVEGDKANGDITLPVKIGRKGAAAISILLIGLDLVLNYVAYPPKDILT